MGIIVIDSCDNEQPPNNTPNGSDYVPSLWRSRRYSQEGNANGQ